MSNGQAPAGGTIGTNGEFYAGGQYLPSTQLPKRSRAAQRKPSGPRRQMIDRYEWADRPDGMVSIYEVIVGTRADVAGGRMVRSEPGIQHYGETVRYMGAVLGTVDDLIAKWNAGERWIAG